jgi:MinD-like ATPase involved in chromosome partitioning or flagellar assembly
MAEVEFADGFDVREPLLWGLAPAQLGTILAAAVLAYLVLRSPLMPAASLPLASLLAAAGTGVALLPFEGRPLVHWLGAAARFHSRPRRGLLVLRGGASPDGSAVETPRRVPLVLLPEPPDTPAEPPASPLAWSPIRDGAGERAGLDPLGCGEAGLRAARRITFFSLAGGAGRTTLAAEMAGLLASAARGSRVAVIDLDLLSPRCGLRLGVPLATEWEEAMASGAAAEAVDRLLRVDQRGVRVLPGPASVPLERPDGELPRRLAAIASELDRRGCDSVILDVPAGLGPVTRWALEAAHDIFVVACPTAGGVQDVYRSTEALRRLGHARKLRYVVNRGAEARLFAEAMADLGGRILAAVPDDPALVRAEAEHRLLGPSVRGATGAALRALAASVDARLGVPPLRGREARRLLHRRAG